MSGLATLARRGAMIVQSSSVIAKYGAVRACSSSNIAGGSLGGPWKDKEHAQENVYFNQEEQRRLKELASKLAKKGPTEAQLKAETTRLDEILQKHGIKDTGDLKDELLAFKHDS